MTERVQKLIAAGGLCSRRTAEAWIEAGRVTVNGHRIALGDRADPDTDIIKVDGRAVNARARADIHQIVGCQHGFVVMLNHDQRVAQIAQVLEGFQKPRVVALVKADGRLVQNVQNAHQRGADLRGQPDALRFAAGERCRGARECEILQADAL